MPSRCRRRLRAHVPPKLCPMVPSVLAKLGSDFLIAQCLAKPAGVTVLKLGWHGGTSRYLLHTCALVGASDPGPPPSIPWARSSALPLWDWDWDSALCALKEYAVRSTEQRHPGEPGLPEPAEKGPGCHLIDCT
ncbi:hypothetical protein F5Y07DRAFT_399552 [Xylaria sp. FL0933]|nr:hypothetical protein F5Y07DRAFT_399552 [Xylaria sp. FL0933]